MEPYVIVLVKQGQSAKTLLEELNEKHRQGYRIVPVDLLIVSEILMMMTSSDAEGKLAKIREILKEEREHGIGKILQLLE